MASDSLWAARATTSPRANPRRSSCPPSPLRGSETGWIWIIVSNCLISIKDYGARYVTATRVAFGHTLYTNEDEARNFAVLNTTNMTSGDFTLGIVCKSYPE